jgi:hypothetical protein
MEAHCLLDRDSIRHTSTPAQLPHALDHGAELLLL